MKIENEGVRSIFLNVSSIKLSKYILWVILHLFIVCFIEIIRIFMSIYITNEDFSDLWNKRMRSKRVNRLTNEGDNDPVDEIQLLGGDESKNLKITSWDLV